ncbi:MAG: HRDC domain-containing protein [Planctomycetes bacterium]|nr:HRDC domain-containing protein [Planctomycetota bacterium]MCB9909740.1 HRDC domain-containing protein [Planctomycetota bacterium]HPF15356.1 HRDC domain-containing protein [Planctomycetota bacterium]
MKQADLGPLHLVEDDQAMAHLLGFLRDQPVIAIDTEADGFHSYREHVCLIQITAGEEDFIIDPLAKVDISGLGEVLADERRIKLFHDSEFDILIMKRDHGFEFRGLFDTRVAAAVLGSAAPGLASVLDDHFGVKLDKSMQRSDWSQRPLSQKQIDYARLDTHYLIPLYHEQRASLAERDLTMVLDTECRRLEAIEPPPHEFKPDEFVRIKGARNLRPQARTILKDLYILRDRLAQERDVPPFRVIANHTMLDLAEHRPRTVAGLGEIKGCSGLIRSRYGKEIVDTIEAALAKEPIRQWPSAPRKPGADYLDEEASELNDRLKQIRKKASDRRSIEAAYLLHRSALARIATARPKDETTLQKVGQLAPWQMDWFADPLLACVAKFEADLKAGTALPKGNSRRRRN